ncbi:conserved unknown protein [Ectocarpus siliculosus]|uniref:Uncharacterized protein n=1 Tax=Ectocarpus siliculosus TaxID=2880 RepID=D8LP11_ECTSI|nr:conserved unknown protein [Ectocarpus siliculosus]|eukprot:CBN80282.1 conserved unknown protein [Ectocarpus siliculosus]
MPTPRSFLFSAAILLAEVDVRAFLIPSPIAAASSSRAPTLPRVSKVYGPSQSLARSGRGIGTRRRWRRSTVAMQAGEKNLFDCIREEDVDTLRRYVERGGPVHVADTLGDTSLLVAASTGNAEVVKILCGAPDAAVNYPCFHGGETPLMAACTQGHLAVTEFLVKEAGANVNATNHRGDTALSLAAFWGRLDCLKLLLSLPDTDTEILNVQGKRAGEGMQELMRDESNDEETVRLLTESRVRRGILRL